jgi:hypothetical protein
MCLQVSLPSLRSSVYAFAHDTLAGMGMAEASTDWGFHLRAQCPSEHARRPEGRSGSP